MITSVTRTELARLLKRGWAGRLDESVFLSRLYDLASLKSDDPRFPNMLEDVRIHADRHPEDTSPDWIFSDKRLELQHDPRLLLLLTETLHPEVIQNGRDPIDAAAQLNRVLAPDGFELYPSDAISGRPVFSWRAILPRTPPQGDFPSSVIAGFSRSIADLTTSTGIDSLFEEEDFPRPIDFGPNKEEKVKSWLRAAQSDETFDHWAGLGRLVYSIVSNDGRYDPDKAKQLVDILAKRNIRMIENGVLTTSFQPGMPTVPAPLPPSLSNWTELGKGGFGIVYRVPDPRLDIEFAIKVFSPYPGLEQYDAQQRFEREAGILFRLRHENIVRVFDAGKLSDGRPFIKMEYFAGNNLYQYRDQSGIDADVASLIVGRLAAAIEHAHSRNVIHRDIKPSNILVSDAKEVRLIDFGLGLVVEESVARSRLTKSTQHFGDSFTAPELLANAKTTDTSIDIYSLGAVWFWLITGQSPRGLGMEDMIDSTNLPPALAALLKTCLMVPDKRPTASALLKQLRSWAKGRKF